MKRRLLSQTCLDCHFLEFGPACNFDHVIMNWTGETSSSVNSVEKCTRYRACVNDTPNVL